MMSVLKLATIVIGAVAVPAFSQVSGAIPPHCAKAKAKRECHAAHLKSELQEQARNALKDPMSAVFGKAMHLASTDDDPPTVVLCGTVNAKNSYGGYVGARQFISATDGRVDFAQPDATSGTGLAIAGKIDRVCSRPWTPASK